MVDTDAAIELAGRVTHLGITELSAMPEDDVVDGMMCGALNVAMHVMAYTDVADWLRDLANQIEALAPTGDKA